MICWQRLALLVTIFALAVGLVAANPTPEESALSIESDWRARSLSYFESADPKARRKEMRKAARALKQPCRYCHTPDFKDYTAKRKISQQMMALSVENGVDCADCHLGKTELSEMGKKSVLMWQISREKGVFCDECHVPKSRFEKLTDQGSKFRATLKKK